MQPEDWKNLKIQVKTLVDLYCEMNNNIDDIKTYLKSIVKHLRKTNKVCNQKKKVKTKKK